MGWSFSQGQIEFVFEGASTEVEVAADGNNLAWVCPECGFPLLFVYRNGRAGSAERSPSRCDGCKASFFIRPEVDAAAEPPAGISRPPADRIELVRVQGDRR